MLSIEFDKKFSCSAAHDSYVGRKYKAGIVTTRDGLK
jgi:hypothetical protein